LEDTCNQGNVIRGFEGYLNLRPTGGMEKKKTRFKEGDRLFSLSSSTYQKVLFIFLILNFFFPNKNENKNK